MSDLEDLVDIWELVLYPLWAQPTSKARIELDAKFQFLLMPVVVR